jgi:hypothetical protein
MNRRDIKRFMPVALFTAITGVLIFDVAASMNWWSITKTVFPFSFVSPHLIGFAPVVTLWLFKFTYRKWWYFLTIDAILNLGHTYIFIPYLVTRGIMLSNIPFWYGFVLATINGILLYGYQIWQEDELEEVIHEIFSSKLQTVASNPLRKPKQKD